MYPFILAFVYLGEHYNFYECFDKEYYISIVISIIISFFKSSYETYKGYLGYLRRL